MSIEGSSGQPPPEGPGPGAQTVGRLLREARESRGLTIAEIAQETKIGKRILRSIEQDEFDQLPGGIFNRAFIRAFAAQVGVDAERGVRLYENALKTERRREPLPPGRRTEVTLWTTAGALALLLAFILWYFWWNL